MLKVLFFRLAFCVLGMLCQQCQQFSCGCDLIKPSPKKGAANLAISYTTIGRMSSRTSANVIGLMFLSLISSEECRVWLPACCWFMSSADPFKRWYKMIQYQNMLVRSERCPQSLDYSYNIASKHEWLSMSLKTHELISGIQENHRWCLLISKSLFVPETWSPRPGSLLIRAKYASLCGSDFPYFRSSESKSREKSYKSLSKAKKNLQYQKSSKKTPKSNHKCCLVDLISWVFGRLEGNSNSSLSTDVQHGASLETEKFNPKNSNDRVGRW